MTITESLILITYWTSIWRIQKYSKLCFRS